MLGNRTHRNDVVLQFSENNFKLFDPVADEAKAQLPSFIQAQPCRWAGRSFEQLDQYPPSARRTLPSGSARSTTADQVGEFFRRFTVSGFGVERRWQADPHVGHGKMLSQMLAKGRRDPADSLARRQQFLQDGTMNRVNFAQVNN